VSVGIAPEDALTAVASVAAAAEARIGHFESQVETDVTQLILQERQTLQHAQAQHEQSQYMLAQDAQARILFLQQQLQQTQGVLALQQAESLQQQASTRQHAEHTEARLQAEASRAISTIT
jgi:hypothetical protein